MSNKCWNKTSEIMPPVKEKVLIVYQNCIYMGHVFHDEDFGYRWFVDNCIMGSIYDLPFVKYWMTLPELPKEKECTLWGVIIPEKIQNYKLSEVETDIKNEEIRLIYKN